MMTTQLNSNLWWKLFRSIPAQFKGSTIETAVMQTLKYYKIPFEIDSFGNIYSMNYKDRPMLSAHMDSVQETMIFPSDMAFRRNEEWKVIFKGQVCMGADDKVGLYIALNYIRSNPKTNFLFSQGEEIGLLGVKHWCRHNAYLLGDVSFGLVLDRKGSGDILCQQNNYGSQEFEDVLTEVSVRGGYGYKPARGTTSDTNELSGYLSCANLSVGYYGAHADNESVVMSEVFNCENYVQAIIAEHGTTRFNAPVKRKSVWDQKLYPSYRGYSKGVRGYKNEIK